MIDTLIFTGHQGFCIAVAEALTRFVPKGCAIIALPWNKGLYRVGIWLPPEPRANLADEIDATASIAGADFYTSHNLPTL